MISKRSKSESRSAWSSRLAQATIAALATVTAAAGISAGCLERPVTPIQPQTSNEFIDRVVQTSVDKIDLLFMIDNSISMADKQQILADAVPPLMRRLVTPNCVNIKTKQTGGPSDSQGKCSQPGFAPEFQPITDIHIGVVTSALGDHGLDGVCPQTVPNEPPRPENNDHAHLLGTIRDVPDWNNLGFLAWDPLQVKNVPPGERDINALMGAFQNHVKAAKDTGCGFEASLEAWYRFLIDPEPPVTVRAEGRTQVVEGVDKEVLAQRAAFLRPDSLVAIIMLTDENDCSVVDETGYQGQLIGFKGSLPRSSSRCEQNPNDPCCLSCASEWPAECGSSAADKSCTTDGGVLSGVEDQLNLRCYNHRKRFGIDLLYPTERYVQGLNPGTVPVRSTPGKEVGNPLFAAPRDKTPRPKQLVFLAGIVGVPWQDIAVDHNAPVLKYMTAAELKKAQRWDVILGDPKLSPPMDPKDPLMIETPDPRSGSNPIVGAALVSADSKDPLANPINGHEYKMVDKDGKPVRDDLQYACTFRLPVGSNPCDARPDGKRQCDCTADSDIDRNKPLCQDPVAKLGVLNTQFFAKAYPGLRVLNVLKDFGENAIVASICPKELNNRTAADYGYNPAVEAIVDRLKEQLKGKCLPRPLAQDQETGKVPCAIIEAKPGGCKCDKPGRVEPSNKVGGPVRQYLLANDFCGGSTGKNCEDYCLCEIRQLETSEGELCRTGGTPNTPGYCYIDEKTPNADKTVLDECSATEKRKLRFVYPSDVPDAEVPAKNAVTVIACMGAAVGSGTAQ